MRPDFVPADPAFAERVRASFDAQAMMNTLGVGITELGPGWIDLEFDHHEDFTQQHGFKHAGAIATALDSACGYAAFSLMPADAAVLTVEYKITSSDRPEQSVIGLPPPSSNPDARSPYARRPRLRRTTTARPSP